MARYYYIARNKSGKKESGVEEASGREEAINRLQNKGLIILNVYSEEKGALGLKEEVVAKTKFKPKHYRVTSDDLVLFCRQLSTLLGAGVTILKSLDIISQQVSSRRLFNVIRGLQKDMEGGFSLHDALAKYPDVFSDLWINLVESGEASGNLAVVLGRLATYLERNAAFKAKIISALIYPAILVFAGTGALFFMAIKIIPSFTEIFKGFNIELPLLTKILIVFSDFLRTKFLILVITICIVIFLFRRYIKTSAGRRRYESFKFNLPAVGEFFRAIVIERFSSEMSTLLESGVPILYSLEITEHSVGNLTTADIIHRIKEDVRNGKPLKEPMEKSGFFEPLVVQMVAIGEEIGELPQMFKKINTFYQEYSETFLNRFVALFEPAILLVMGTAIGIMVVGMFLPIFQIAKIGE